MEVEHAKEDEGKKEGRFQEQAKENENRKKDEL